MVFIFICLLKAYPHASLSYFINPFFSFFGVIIGTTLSGLLVININENEIKRIDNREAERLESVKKTLNYYLKLLSIEYKTIMDLWEEYLKIDDPYKDLDSKTDENGVERYLNVPPDKIGKEYSKEVKPIENEIKEVADRFIHEAKKLNDVNIDPLNLVELDKFFEKQMFLRQTILPKFGEVRHNGLADFSKEEKSEADKLFEIFN